MATYGSLQAQYRARHGKLVQPRQGWNSLHPDLWLAYSMGRKRGYDDVGTYANKPGDHSWGDRHGEPGMALAFDLRRPGWNGRYGWGWLNARRLARFYVKHAYALNLNYVICGRKYASRRTGFRWVPLTTGDTSHDWHLHVSGADPDGHQGGQ